MTFLTKFENNWRSLESIVSIYLELKFGEFDHIGKIIHKGHYMYHVSEGIFVQDLTRPKLPFFLKSLLNFPKLSKTVSNCPGPYWLLSKGLITSLYFSPILWLKGSEGIFLVSRLGDLKVWE